MDFYPVYSPIEWIKWIKIQPTHVKFLYRLLSQREAHQNISHKVMPTFEAHTNFVNSKPYLEWYIIVVDNLFIGAIYLTKEFEIGLFIDKKYRGCGFGSIALNKLIQETHIRPLYANISPRNIRSQKFFERNGFQFKEFTEGGDGEPIQYVYKYDISPDDFYGSY